MTNKEIAYALEAYPTDLDAVPNAAEGERKFRTALALAIKKLKEEPGRETEYGRQAKLIYCCGDCIYYSMKKHYCTRGAKDEGNAQDYFYKDCPLDDFEAVAKGVKEE